MIDKKNKDTLKDIEEDDGITIDEDGVIIIEEIEDIDEDIKEEKKEEDDDTSTDVKGKNVKEPGMAWKEKGMDHNEMSSRRINRKKALENESKQKTNLKSNDGKKTAPKELLAAGVQKLNTKIKQNAYDDEDEDDKSHVIVGTLDDSSLANALTKEENKKLKDMDNKHNNMMLQNASKIQVVNDAQIIANRAGVDVTKTIDKKVNDATYSQDKMSKFLKKDVAKELKIKNPGNIPASKHKDLIDGVKKIKENGGKVDGMNVSVVASAAKETDKGVAEIIYKNANNVDKKKIHRQADIDRIKQKTGRNNIDESTKEKISVKEIEKGNVRINQKSR